MFFTGGFRGSFNGIYKGSGFRVEGFSMGSGSGLQPPNIESSGFRALALRVTGLRCWVICVCVLVLSVLLGLCVHAMLFFFSLDLLLGCMVLTV